MIIHIMAQLGFFISFVMIVGGVALLLCLIWFIFLLSKIIFKGIFANETWENIFIFVVGFPTLMQIFYGSIIGLNVLDGSHKNIGDQYYYYSFIDLERNLFPLLLIFLIAYLIQFMIRLVRHKKQKAIDSIENK